MLPILFIIPNKLMIHGSPVRIINFDRDEIFMFSVEEYH